jgi:hypothetical protein
MANPHFFGTPLSDGAFDDIIDDLRRAGLTCTAERPSFVHCSGRGAKFTIVHDVEGGIRAYLVDAGGLGEGAWALVDPVLMRTFRTGFADEDWDLGLDICSMQPCPYTDVDGKPTMYASGRPAGHVGGDESIDTTGKFLNADGSSSWPGASGLLDDGWTGPSLPGGYPQRDAMERLHGKPHAEVMADHARKTEALRAQRGAKVGAECVGAFFYDADLAKFGNAFSPFVQTNSPAWANLALQRPFQDRYSPRYDNQTWADWMGMSDEWVGASGPQIMGDAREVGGAVDTRALLASAAIVGVAALFATRNKEHWLEISAAGAAGVALVWGLSASRSGRLGPPR